MKRKLFLVCLFLTGIFTSQAQNLIENGSFEEGKENWRGQNIGVESFKDAKDGEKYLESQQDDWGFGPYNANANYTKTVAEGIGGKTYAFTLWAWKGKRTDLTKLTVNLAVKDSEGNGIYVSENGISFGNFKLKETGNEVAVTGGSWVELSLEIKFTEKSHTITRLGINLKEEKMRVDDVKFEEVKQAHPAPANLKAAETHQREAKITWDVVEGATAYSVKVGDNDVVEVTENSYMITGLTPGSTTKVIVKSSEADALESEIEVTTTAVATVDLDRIPYVLLPEDGNIQKSFFIHIYDTKDAPVIKEVTLDGTKVEETNGVYSLREGEGRVLKVTLTDGNQDWVLEYRGLKVQ